MKIIDVKNWKRRTHFELFNSYSQPCFRLDVRLDMTKFMESRKSGHGFFLPFLYLLMRAINETEGLRLRLQDKKVIDVERVDASFTLMLENGNFAFCKVAWNEDYSSFFNASKSNMAIAEKEGLKGTENYFETNNALDLVYLSCLPWIDFLSCSNPLPLGNELSMCIPRLNWGKCVKNGEKYEMTLSVTANHALIDGYELSQFFIKLQNYLDNAQEFFK